MGRSEQEAELARILANVQSKERRKLLAALGEPPNLDNVTPEFWQQYSHSLRKEIVPALEKMFMASAEAMLAQTPAIGVDWTLINKNAAEWASRYGFDLVSGITDTTREALQQKVSAFFENQMTMPQFAEALEPLFGPVRAEMLAITETTRAANAGLQGVVDELDKTGIVMVARWSTAVDEHVCPICEPLDGKLQGDGWDELPPAHPRCRCLVVHEFEKQ